MAASLREVRLGLVGFGRWGRRIAATIPSVPGARLAAVAVRSPAVAKDAPPGCAVESDWRSLLNGRAVDALIIATPAASHAEIAVAALEADMPVFVEKPLALSVADADRVREAAAARGAILHVNHIDLFNPAWRAFVGALPACGALRSIEAEFGADRRSTSTPAYWDWGPHPIALCISLLGPPSLIHAVRREVTMDAELVEIHLRFRGEVDAVLTVGEGFPQRRRRLVAVAERCTLVYDDNAANKVVEEVEGVRNPIPVLAGRPLDIAVTRFVAAVRQSRADFDDGEIGVAVTRVLSEVEATLTRG